MIRLRPIVRTVQQRPTTPFGLIPTMLMAMLIVLSTWTKNDVTTINAFMVVSPTVTMKNLQQQSVRSISQVTSSLSSPLSVLSLNYHRNDNLENDDDAVNTNIINVQQDTKQKSTQPTPILLQQAQQFDALSKKFSVSMMTAVMIFLTSLSISSSLLPLPANAAMSGGRMGGSFSSRGGGGGGMRMAPSRSSGGGGSFYGGGSRSSYYGPRSSTIIAPIISPFASTPFITPFYNPIVPYYGGGVGAISYNRGPGLFDLLFLGGIGWFVVSAISNTINTRTISQWDDYDNTGNNLFGGASAAMEPTTVVKCSVAVDVSNRDDPNSILSVLDRMAKVTAKTDTRKGVQTLTKQVALELLRRKSSIYSASGTIQQYKNSQDAQRTYNQWSITERSKFEQENINKFGKFDLSLMKNKDTTTADTAASKATMAVVTIILSVQGSQGLMNISNNKMKKIQSRSDLESILQSIASLDTNNDDLYGAEILWTPEDRSETLTRKDIIADYPELTTL
jgi:uncharacterized membrane protein